MIKDELKNIGIDLIDKFFPKRNSNERGQVLVFYALLLQKFENWHKQRMLDLLPKEKILVDEEVASKKFLDRLWNHDASIYNSCLSDIKERIRNEKEI